MADNVYKFREGRSRAPKPIGHPKPNRAPGRYFSGLVVLCLLIGFVAVQFGLKASAPPQQASTHPSIMVSRIHVVDGDTVRLNDGGPDVRLVGFNTPETGSRARCEAERSKGQAAKARLRELIGAGPVSFRQVPCACERGTEGTDRCNFGRRCGTIVVRGRDIGELLIAEGLAVRFVCAATDCPPLPRPWC